MESKIKFLKKPAAGAARIWILYRSPLENVQNFRKGGSVRIYPDVCIFPHFMNFISFYSPFGNAFVTMYKNNDI